MPRQSNGKSVEILLVDDSAPDVRLMQETFKDAKVANNISVAMDGVEAMAFLRREGQYAKAPRPDLILLDLNMPKKDGRQTLAEIRSDPNLTIIPVVILTTSDADADIIKSYELHANCYVKKPVDLDEFSKVVEAIEDFWFCVVRLPVSTPVVT